ncbi:alpha/beta fold hydrolase [Lacticaseibacillus thailandensis]|uniref:alpha/beta fold hydrolase n=1 Tax=Lacticaseibacillus thailandensis TaxID=381741 RepID=UPI001CDB1983|nr:hypothetical protein [Lacticaseibacillus thailandensis]
MAARRDFWQHPTASKRAQYRNAFAPATIRGQYLNGAPAMAVGPDGYTLDIAYTRTAGYAERQLDLIYDYQTNVRLYPRFQEYIRQHQPRLLAVWGKNDASFIYPGALAFRRDAPRAKVVLLDTGHFALESHAGTIAQLIKEYFTGEQ